MLRKHQWLLKKGSHTWTTEPAAIASVTNNRFICMKRLFVCHDKLGELAEARMS